MTQKDKIIVGVTGTGSLIGQAIIKSIKLSDLCQKTLIIGFDYFNETVGSFWCNKTYILPDILDKNISEKTWLRKAVEIIEHSKVKLLFVGVDFELPLFAKYKQYIKQQTGCEVIVGSQELIQIANDKYLTYKFLKNNGFFYPKTYLPEEFDFNCIKLPFVLKPRVGARSRGVYLINSRNDYLEKIKHIKEPIIQEHIGDADKEYTCGVLCLNNKETEAIVLKRKLKDGNTSIANYSTNTPSDIYDYIITVSKRLKIYGSCNFQLRIDDKQIPKIFEINPRHSGTTYMRALLGFNEVDRIIKYHYKLPLSPIRIKEGTVIRFFDEQLIENP
jgi:carbamoyl-phosphate synthase large subunit